MFFLKCIKWNIFIYYRKNTTILDAFKLCLKYFNFIQFPFCEFILWTSFLCRFLSGEQIIWLYSSHFPFLTFVNCKVLRTVKQAMSFSILSKTLHYLRHVVITKFINIQLERINLTIGYFECFFFSSNVIQH